MMEQYEEAIKPKTLNIKENLQIYIIPAYAAFIKWKKIHPYVRVGILPKKYPPYHVNKFYKIAISKRPTRLDKKRIKDGITLEDFEKIFDWVFINYNILKDIWKLGESYWIYYNDGVLTKWNKNIRQQRLEYLKRKNNV
jgi:hypothetical protein